MNMNLRTSWLRLALLAMATATVIAFSPAAVERLYGSQGQVCCEINCLFGSCGAEGFCECECILGMPMCTCTQQQ